MTSLFEANRIVEAKSSALPWPNLLIIFAVAGTTKIKSAHLDKAI